MEFSALLQSVSGFFSRSFWFSRFLPVALIALAHELLGRWLFGWQFDAGITKMLKSDMGKALLSFAALVVLAYGLSPLIPLISGVLDGSILPARLHNRLREGRRSAWKRAKESPNSAYDTHLQYSDKRVEWKAALCKAAEKGNALQSADDQQKFDVAKAAVDAFETAPRLHVAELVSTLDKAGAALTSALEANSSELSKVKLSGQLDALHTRFRGVLDELVNEAAHQLRAAESRLGVTDEEDFQPTRFGDARQLIHRYAKRTYSVPFDYLWPRVRLAILSGEAKEGTGAPRMVSDAVAQVEFAIFLFALWWTIPSVWLPLILVNGKAVWAFLAIGIAAPLVGMALYELAVQAEIVAARTVATALDRYRRDALKELGFDPPATLSAERQLWLKLYRSREPKVDLIYAKTAGGTA